MMLCLASGPLDLEGSPRTHKTLNGDFPKLGVPFGGPYDKDYTILGSILGSPYFGKLPNPQLRIGFFRGSGSVI